MKKKQERRQADIQDWTNAVNDNAHDAVRGLMHDALDAIGIEFEQMSDTVAADFERIKADIVALTMVVAVENRIANFINE